MTCPGSHSKSFQNWSQNWSRSVVWSRPVTFAALPGKHQDLMDLSSLLHRTAGDLSCGQRDPGGHVGVPAQGRTQHKAMCKGTGWGWLNALS